MIGRAWSTDGLHRFNRGRSFFRVQPCL